MLDTIGHTPFSGDSSERPWTRHTVSGSIGLGDYDEFTQTSLAGLNPFSPTARELKRFFFNASFDTELDAANRVMIPTPLLEYAGLSKEVVVTGSGECLEVWDRGRYAQNFRLAGPGGGFD